MHKFILKITKFFSPRNSFSKVAPVTESEVLQNESLYEIDNNRREKASVWELIKSPNMMALCNDTFRWLAVGIPLNLIDKSQPDGDIDLMVVMLVFAGATKDGNPDFRTVYRSFEVKTSKISSNSDVRSLKTNQLKKHKKQLQKLRDFGANQIFLLWTFILEAGYLEQHHDLPIEIHRDIEVKLGSLIGHEYGYEVFYSVEDSGGFPLFVPNTNIYPAKELPIGEPFNKLVKFLDNFYNEQLSSSNARIGLSMISYCYNCKKLILVYRDGPYSCGFCHKALF